MAARDVTRRKSAEQRREEIVRIAIEHFALGGYNGTSTEAIARDAGISQPYLFRLFRTKRELFLACCGTMHRRIGTTFETAARDAPEDEVLEAMGAAYIALLQDRHTLLFQMQSYAACADPEIQAHVRDGYATLVRLVEEVSGASPAELWAFFSTGMLLNVIAALDLDTLAVGGEEWARCWADPKTLLEDAAGAA
jgi:AcrR family transcriptional regulator